MRIPSAALLLGAATLAAGLLRPAAVQGNPPSWVVVPGTSVEQPGDRSIQAHTNHVILAAPAGGLGPGGGMTPDQLRAFYGVPAGGGASVIAIVIAYHYPSALNDFNVFSQQF